MGEVFSGDLTGKSLWPAKQALVLETTKAFKKLGFEPGWLVGIRAN